MTKFITINDFNCISPSGAKQTRYKASPNYTEGLYDLKQGLYAWMVPNGSWGESNAGLIIGEGESLLVDTLWDVQYTRTMLKAMQPLLTEAALKYVVNTHADGDHFWGNQLVTEAEIITSQASYDEMLTTLPKSLLLLGKVGKFLSALRILNNDQVGHWFQGMVKPYNFAEVKHTPATRTFNTELELDVGGRKVQLIEVGPAHTHGDLMVYVPEAKTLFSADILFIESTPVIWAGPLENWLTALDKILTLDVETIVPGHGPITNKAGVKLVKTYWEYIGRKVEQCFKAGMSANEAAHSIVLHDQYAQQPFGSWDSPERMMTNAFTLYRHLSKRTTQPQVPELLKIMRQQALLAHKLPYAQPASMRKHL